MAVCVASERKPALCEQLVRLGDLLEPDMCMHMCMLLGSSLQHVTGKYVAASCCNPGKPLLGGVTMGALRTCAGASWGWLCRPVWGAGRRTERSFMYAGLCLCIGG